MFFNLTFVILFFGLFFAFLIFIMCDIIVGLSSAKGIYFDLATSPFLDSLLTGTRAWIFYMPSQILIALSTFKYNKKKKE